MSSSTCTRCASQRARARTIAARISLLCSTICRPYCSSSSMALQRSTAAPSGTTSWSTRRKAGTSLASRRCSRRTDPPTSSEPSLPKFSCSQHIKARALGPNCISKCTSTTWRTQNATNWSSRTPTTTSKEFRMLSMQGSYSSFRPNSEQLWIKNPTFPLKNSFRK